jgi:nucleoside-diphosphate-sugar epimerase
MTSTRKQEPERSDKATAKGLIKTQSLEVRRQNMRVFVTGATGFIGSAIVRELIDAGHQVLGLARSDAAAKSLAAAGAKIHRGDLEDLDSLRRGAADSEGVIHTAFSPDWSTFEANCKTERRAIEAIGPALAGSDRPFVVASATPMLKWGRLGTEEDATDSNNFLGALRGPGEEMALSMAPRGVRVSVVRLPPLVHGDGDHGFTADHGFTPLLISFGREKGLSAYIGDGLNRWPAVHRLDAAHLFRLALEKAPAGARVHGVAEEGIAFRDIADVIGRRLNIPVVTKSPEEAANHFGWFAPFPGVDCPASSKLTQERLGWRPVQPSLFTDFERESYFKT